MYAATNPDIARSLNASWMEDVLKNSTNAALGDVHITRAAKELWSRVQAWAVLEDALTNTQADFNIAANALKEISADEQSFGIWLESMVMHEDVTSVLTEHPILPTPLPHPPPLFQSSRVSISHDEYIAFLRALIGVSCVLAVYAWADSLPHEHCRERTLGIIRLWQGIDGYKEVIQFTLISRFQQLTPRYRS